ncbi:MAG TPA: hypothetical protein VME20_11895 [Acidimicrobiales bacterium]|nr:hypothetical protein [Acidimicrobiales bacterium]
MQSPAFGGQATKVWRRSAQGLAVDDVIRAEGGDLEAMQRRGSEAPVIAARALELSRGWLHPRAAVRYVVVMGRKHHKIMLEDGVPWALSAVQADQLSSACQLAAVVCTIGPQLEEKASLEFKRDPALAVAIDAVGSAALHRLQVWACQRVEQQAARRSWHASLPLSPGVGGWDLVAGQRQLFGIVDAARIEVTLTASSMMRPLKSTSFVLGLGPGLATEGTECDLCELADICRYRSR